MTSRTVLLVQGSFPVQQILLFCVLINPTPCLSENDRQAILNDFLAFETIPCQKEKEPCWNCYKDWGFCCLSKFSTLRWQFLLAQKQICLFMWSCNIPEKWHPVAPWRQGNKCSLAGGSTDRPPCCVSKSVPYLPPPETQHILSLAHPRAISTGSHCSLCVPDPATPCGAGQCRDSTARL